MVAILVLPDDHVPPNEASDNVETAPKQTFVVPVIDVTDGLEFIFKDFDTVVIQPAALVTV